MINKSNCRNNSWNIWQCIYLNMVQKVVMKKECNYHYSQVGTRTRIRAGCKSGNIYKHNGIYCKIKDWKANKTIKFVDMIQGGNFYA